MSLSRLFLQYRYQGLKFAPAGSRLTLNINGEALAVSLDIVMAFTKVWHVEHLSKLPACVISVFVHVFCFNTIPVKAFVSVS